MIIRKSIRDLIRKIKYLYLYRNEFINGIKNEWYPIFVKYPVRPIPRFGYNGIGPHPILYELFSEKKETYLIELNAFKEYINILKITCPFFKHVSFRSEVKSGVIWVREPILPSSEG